MKNIVQIIIQKNKQQVRFFVHEQEMSFATVCALCKKEQIALCHVQTFEEGRQLLECYIPFRDNEVFRRRLIKAAKAKA